MICFMRYSEYIRIERLEKIHFWYRAMEEMAINLINNYFGNIKIKILDTGCGTGGMTKKLEQFGDVTGIDINEKALILAKKKGLKKILKADVCNLPFKDKSFDLVTSFDVLYHRGISDDMKAIKEMHRVLKPCGLLFIRVPAFEFLRGSHDIIVQTRHRYTVGELKLKLETIGFKIEKLIYANTVLSFPLFIKRSIERSRHKRAHSEITSLPKILNEILYFFLKNENKLMGYLPFGTSIICNARKR